MKPTMTYALLMALLLLLTGASGGTKVKSVFLKPLSQSVAASFSGCTLQTYMVRSRLDCVRRCLSLISCISLRYTPLGPDTASCVCLSSCVKPSMNTMSQNTTYFHMSGRTSCGTSSKKAWFTKACREDADCPVEYSECYSQSSTCLCTPGYYYSSSCNVCVPWCDPRNLLDTFVTYVHSCQYGHDDITYKTSFTKCMAACAANRRCLTFDHTSANGCSISYDTVLTTKSFGTSCGPITSSYSQRMCC